MVSCINFLFYYSISCGYAKAYQEYASLISENFPHIIVSGENYNTGTLRTLIANVLNIARMALIFLIIMNKNPFLYFRVQTPQVWFWLTQHKIPGCLLIFFITNTLEANLMSSGAFEIFLDGKLTSQFSLFAYLIKFPFPKENEYGQNSKVGEYLHIKNFSI